MLNYLVLLLIAILNSTRALLRPRATCEVFTLRIPQGMQKCTEGKMPLSFTFLMFINIPSWHSGGINKVLDFLTNTYFF